MGSVDATKLPPYPSLVVALQSFKIIFYGSLQGTFRTMNFIYYSISAISSLSSATSSWSGSRYFITMISRQPQSQPPFPARSALRGPSQPNSSLRSQRPPDYGSSKSRRQGPPDEREPRAESSSSTSFADRMKGGRKGYGSSSLSSREDREQPARHRGAGSRPTRKDSIEESPQSYDGKAS
jgi:hypothetical protein